ARRHGGRGAREDHGAGVHRRLHPEAAARAVRDEGAECGSMSALPEIPLTPTLSPAGERGPGAHSLSRWRERAGVRVGVAIALFAVAVLAPILNLIVPPGSLFHM